MRRPLFLLLALVATVGLVVGSGGFTSVSADRTTAVTVVDDKRAYLDIADKLQCGKGGGKGDNKNAVVNQFPATTLDTITVEATIPAGETGELRIGPGGQASQIGPGESETISLDTNSGLGPGESAEIQVKPPKKGKSAADTVVFSEVRVSSSSVSVTVNDRTVDVDCPSNNGEGKDQSQCKSTSESESKSESESESETECESESESES